MERKGGSTAVLTAEQVKSALNNRTRALTSEEEKSVRMRHGVGVKEMTQALPRAAGGNAELADELLLIEMQLLRAFRAKTGASRPQASRMAAEPATGAKGKIIRALRKKK